MLVDLIQTWPNVARHSCTALRAIRTIEISLKPVNASFLETCEGVDGHQDDGGGSGNFLADSGNE
jgi:hypothetical protein